MQAKYTHDIVATVGRYKDRSTGEEKKQYLTVGKCFTDDQGRQSLIIDAIPVTHNWTGWLSLYPAKERQQQQDTMPEGRAQQRSMPPAPAKTQAQDDDFDAIPF